VKRKGKQGSDEKTTISGDPQQKGRMGAHLKRVSESERWRASRTGGGEERTGGK